MIRFRADLPFERDQATRFVPWIVALMVFLGALALAATTAVGGAIDRWDNNLSGRITVQVPADKAGPKTLTRLAETLTETPGIAQAEILSDEATRALVEPWLGVLDSDLELPLPAVIDVETEAGAVFDVNLLTDKLTKIAPGVIVDDHRVWLQQLIRVARTVEWVAFAILGLIGLTAIAAVIFATRSGLAVHAAIINLLHVMGARDAYIARQFQMQAMMLGIRGGIIGSAAAIIVLILLATMSAGIDVALLPSAPLSLAQWPLLIIVPIAAVVIAMATARVTVLRALAGMP
ncbi:MAG: cell division protein [Alphaproteobacteria bacterium]|nr:cell division protein [Alphaproteobacteria bacterium]